METPAHGTPEFNRIEIHKFAIRFGILVALLALIPVFIGLLAAPESGRYLPFPTGMDDQMVYAAWVHQSADGQLLFDNRFTTMEQPGLTIHVYFLVVGWLAKLIGISLALTVARAGFSFLAVVLLGKFLARLNFNSFTGKFAVVLAVLGGGLSFIAWQMFGRTLETGAPWFGSIMSGHSPIDNWQPEAFVFPSMLVNGLFMASLCLILVVFISVLNARESWKPVLPAAAAMAVLMNIHSYDVLLLVLVLIAFVASLFASGQLTWLWTVRCAAIGLGALPSALWFLHVLRVDEVFQARANTLTYTGSFAQILVGILPLFVLAMITLHRSELEPMRRKIGLALICGGSVVLFILAKPQSSGYVVNAVAWGAMIVLAIVAVALLARKDLGWNLLWSWALVGLVAPYFPALFQRKLTMMLAVPWAIIGAIGLAQALQRMDRQPRNLVAALALAVCSATSVFWLQRELTLVRSKVSSTTVHALYLTRDEAVIVDLLNEISGKKTVIAMTGVSSADLGSPPYLSDLNPILSGLTGAYTYAGHWSETPSYGGPNGRRDQNTAFFIQEVPLNERFAILEEWGIDYVVAPVPETYSQIRLVDLTPLGEIVYEGNQLRLIRVRRP
ncbi:MAG: hypothetical protein IH944_00330 [Armatimonadetes bacterium]|nr:hypothetical protein [Armatimonadota bacterium]